MNWLSFWKKRWFPMGILLLFLLMTAIIVHVFLGVIAEVTETASWSGPVRTLVIDAGHGGLDGGAVAADGTTESVLNLEIANRLEQLARLWGTSVQMTRRSETLDYPEPEASVRAKKAWDQKRRVELINAEENAVLISIHQNKYPDPRPSGSQVLYAATAGSKELAELTHDNLISALNPGNRRVAAPISETIYLMKRVKCPAILVECGFLSNRAETERLKSGDYQKALACVLFASFRQFQSQETQG